VKRNIVLEKIRDVVVKVVSEADPNMVWETRKDFFVKSSVLNRALNYKNTLKLIKEEPSAMKKVIDDDIKKVEEEEKKFVAEIKQFKPMGWSRGNFCVPSSSTLTEIHESVSIVSSSKVLRNVESLTTVLEKLNNNWPESTSWSDIVKHEIEHLGVKKTEVCDKMNLQDLTVQAHEAVDKKNWQLAATLFAQIAEVEKQTKTRKRRRGTEEFSSTESKVEESKVVAEENGSQDDSSDAPLVDRSALFNTTDNEMMSPVPNRVRVIPEDV